MQQADPAADQEGDEEEKAATEETWSAAAAHWTWPRGDVWPIYGWDLSKGAVELSSLWAVRHDVPLVPLYRGSGPEWSVEQQNCHLAKREAPVQNLTNEQMIRCPSL
jgi:hypothetical protein